MQANTAPVQFDQFVDEISDLIFVVERGYRLVYANLAVERILGLRWEALVETSVLHLIHPDDAVMIRDVLDRSSGMPQVELQVRLLSTSGSYRTLRVRALMEWSDAGRPVRGTVIAQDITEHVALNEAHIRRSTHLTAMMELFERGVADSRPDTLLQQLLLSAMETIPAAQRGSIWIRHGDGFRCAAACGWPMETLSRVTLPLDDPRAAAFRDGNKILRLRYSDEVNEHGPELHIKSRFRRFDLPSIAVSLSAPIFLEGKLYGYINLDNLDVVDAFDDLASEALILFAGQSAVNLKYQRLLDRLAEAHEHTKLQASRQTLLARIATIINSTLAIEDVLQRSLELISEPMGVRQAGIMFFDYERDAGYLVAQWRSDGAVDPEGVSIPLAGNPAVEWLREHRTPLAIDDAWNSPFFTQVQDVVRPQNIHSMLLLPLIINDEVIGSVGLDSLEKIRHFQPDEVEFAHVVSQQIAVAVERARLYEQAIARRQLAETIKQLVLLVNSGIERRAMLREALDLIGTVLPFDRASIMLVSEGYLQIVAARGIRDELLEAIAPHLSEQMFDELLQSRNAIILNNAHHSPSWITLEGEDPVESWLGVPLMVDDQVLGILNFDKFEPDFYQPSHVEIIHSLADHIATALYNTALYEQAQARVRELSALLQVSTTLNQSLHLDTILEILSDELYGLVGQQRCALILCGRDAMSMRVASSRGVPVAAINDFNTSGPHHDCAAIVERMDSQRSMEYSISAGEVAGSGLSKLFSGDVTLLTLVDDSERVIGLIAVEALLRDAAQHRLLYALADLGTSAIVRWELYEQAQQRVAQVEALHLINLQTTASLDLTAVLNAIAHSVLTLTGAGYAHIWLCDECDSEPRFEYGACAWSSHSDEELWIPSTPVRSNGLTAKVAKSRQVILIEDAPNHPLFGGNIVQSWRLRSIAGVPLLAQSQVLGVLNISFMDEPHQFSADEIRLLELFAGHGALAIQNARLFQRERQQREGLEALHRTALTLTAVRDPDLLMTRAVEESIRVFDADAAAFWKWDSNQDAIVIGASQGLSREYVSSRRLSRMYLKRRDGGFNYPLIINDLPTNTTYPHPAAVVEGIQHSLTVPIRNSEQWLGALVLYNRDKRKPFREDHLQRATAFAAQLALALENSTHFEQATQRANQLMTLNNVMLEVSQEMEIDKTLQMIVEQAYTLVNGNGGVIFLRDRQYGQPIVAAASFPVAAGTRMPATELLGDLLLKGQSLLIADLDEWQGLPSGQDVGPILGVPLLQGKEVIGVMAITRPRKAPRFDSDDLWLVELFGQQAAVALARANMVNEMQRRLLAMVRLRTSTLAISQQLDLSALHRALVEQACILLSCEMGFFFESTPETEEPILHSNAIGSVSPPITDLAISVARRVEQEQHSLIIHHSTLSKLVPNHDDTPGTVVGLPLIHGTRLLGSLVLVGNEELQTDDHVEFVLNLFSTQAAIALENALLYRQSEELKQFNENIIQWMDEGILMLESSGTITYANRAAEAMLGYPPGGLIGTSNMEICFPEDHGFIRLQMAQRHQGQNSRYELRMKASNGEPVPVVISAKSLFNAEGNFDKSMVVFTNISERKRLEQRLLQADKLSAIGELVSGVAHELNNPLTSIIGYAQLIGMNGPEGNVSYDIERIQSEAKRAARIVKNLLAFARQHRPEQQFVHVNDLLHSTLDLRAYQLNMQGIEVSWNLEEHLPLTQADPHQIQQVIMNLVINAEHAMETVADSRVLTIQTRLLESAKQPTIQIVLSDTGVGMNNATLARIFDPFFTTKDVGQGTGLGLSICFGIIQEHGGTIEATSTPGVGTSFVIYLPVKSAVVQSVVPLPPTSAAAIAAPPLHPLRLMVVDDERPVCQLVAQVLKLHGHRVAVAASAEEAIDLLRQDAELDLLLSDIKMPGLGGQGLYAWLEREAPQLARRTVFMTGDTVNPETQSLLEASNRPHLAKPFRVEELESFIRHVVTTLDEEG